MEREKGQGAMSLGKGGGVIKRGIKWTRQEERTSDRLRLWVEIN